VSLSPGPGALSAHPGGVAPHAVFPVLEKTTASPGWCGDG
jgi:hypothetical protein